MTSADLARHQQFADRGTLRIAVTGATGFIGSRLVPFLAAGGHEVRRLVRERPASAGADIYWRPSERVIDAAGLEGVDAVVHLAGESIAERWTDARKLRIRRSRVEGTRFLSEALGALERPPGVLVSASAVGIYGERGDEILTEASPPGAGFLAEVAQEWERATSAAERRGVRVVHARFGVVLGADGGALGKMLLPFKLGVGGTLGGGDQWVSWVARDDVIGAVHFAIFTDRLAGPVNVVAPHPATNAELTKALGRVLGRPTVAKVPAFAVKLLFGEMGEATVLASQRAVPRKLLAAGFAFRHPTVEEALRFELGR